MKRTSIFLDPSTERDLQAIARRRRAPVASVVREALTRYVVAEKADGTRPRFVAAGRSGSSDIAERHEELLFAHALAPPARKARRRPPVKRR